ncbi:MAG: ABC transporter substrate-binding protein, partial [Candidatus Sifarchaeia archaeon]
MRRSRSALSLCCIFLIILFQIPLVVCIDIPEDIRYGPFIDRAVYKVIVGDDQRALALESGAIDIGSIYQSQVSTLDANPDIDILECPRNGHFGITINCSEYPLNISGFRRAFAFAFNKIKAIDYVYEGHATLHDSVVPSTSRWCAENLLEYHYYEADIERGNSLLDELGFAFNTTTGFRDAPNGEPFTVRGYNSPTGPAIVGAISQLACETLDSLNINNDWYNPGWEPWPRPQIFNDMVVTGWYFGYNTIAWENLIQFSNYRNDTVTYWIDKYNDWKTYNEVFEASTEIQKNLHYNVPRLVVCQDNYHEAVRNNQFQGHVEDANRYFSGPWTLRRIHEIDGSYGGLFSIALNGEPDGFNIYTAYSSYSHLILENLYSCLYSHDPNMNPIPDLAESMLVETHSNNSLIPDGHMRFTFDILQNATWSDGRTMTADDIAFTFLYQLESGLYGNPAADSLSGLFSVYAPSTYRVVFEFSSESHWNFNKIAYEYIIPEHIFTAIGYSGWNTWNPVYNPDEPHVTCGPFLLTDFEDGEYYELTANPE